MNTRLLVVLGATMLASFPGVRAAGQEMPAPYVQLAEIDIDPDQLDAYKAAVQEQIETAVRVEPGVLVLYAVAEKDRPTRVRVFEIYKDADAYKAHLQSDHFKKYKAVTETMVRSLNLVQTTPIALGAKPR